MKTKVMLMLALFVLPVASLWSQMNSQPGAEVKKLEYFSGTWTMDGNIAQGPWGAGGKFTSTATNEWMAGNFFMQVHSNFKMPAEIGGDGKSVAFIGYDTNQNLYTYDEFNSQGRHDSSKGSFIKDTWTWNSSQTYDGQDVQQKMTMKVLSPASYSFKFEVSMDGKTWMTFMEGKATKK